MALFDTYTPYRQTYLRPRTFQGNFKSNLLLALSGSNASGTSNTWGKIANVGLPVGLGIVAGYFGGAAGGAAGSALGNLANRGLNAGSRNILSGTDAEQRDLQTTTKEERDDALTSALGNLAGNITSGIRSNIQANKGNSLEGISDQSISDYLYDEAGTEYGNMAQSLLRNTNANATPLLDNLFGGNNNNQSGMNWAALSNSLLQAAQPIPTASQAGYTMPTQPMQNSSILPNPDANSNITYLQDRSRVNDPYSMNTESPYRYLNGFAEGGEILPMKYFENFAEGGMVSGPGKQAYQDIRDFYSGYLRSPKFQERALATRIEDPDELAGMRLAALNRLRVTGNLGSVGNRSSSGYSLASHTVNINPADAKEFNTTVQNIAAHEFSHAINGALDAKKANRSFRLNPAEIQMFDERRQYLPGSPALNALPVKQMINYIYGTQPSEAKADMDALRYQLKRDGIYDTGTQDFNQQHLQKARQKYKDNRFLKNYKDSDILFLMNSIASIADTPANRFNDGGEIPFKYFDGGPTPTATIYPSHDKTTEDFYMVDKGIVDRHGLSKLFHNISFGQGRYGERIFDQESNLLQKSIMKSNMSEQAKKLALGEHIFQEIKTHKDFSSGKSGTQEDNFAKGGVVTPANVKPQVSAFQAQYNQWARANGQKPIKVDGLFGSETQGAIEKWNASNPEKYKFDINTTQTTKTGSPVNTLGGIQLLSVDTPVTATPNAQANIDTNLPEAFANIQTQLQNGTAPVSANTAPAISTPSSSGRTLTPAQRENLLGTIGDLAGAGIGAVIGSQGIPRYQPTEEYTRMLNDVYARKDQGLAPEELSAINQGLANNYATSVNTIRAVSGGGGTQGAVLGALGNASSQLNDGYLQTALQDVVQRRNNYGRYQNAVMNDLAIDQNIFAQDQQSALASQQAGLTLLDRSLQNIADRRQFNQQYGEGSAYSNLLNSFNQGTDQQNSRSTGLVAMYRRLLEDRAKPTTTIL